jgi:homoserine acetyltransferase
MSKKHKSSQFTPNNSSSQPKSATPPNYSPNSVSSSPTRVQPEQMSLNAHAHIQKYLKETGRNSLTKEDLNAVLRLSQHLRVFGLLSAVGYINQANQQDNNVVRKRTVPVWKCLINNLLEPQSTLPEKALMEKVIAMSRNNPSQYMISWRKSLQMSNHWNFWARAYSDS